MYIYISFNFFSTFFNICSSCVNFPFYPSCEFFLKNQPHNHYHCFSLCSSIFRYFLNLQSPIFIKFSAKINIPPVVKFNEKCRSILSQGLRLYFNVQKSKSKIYGCALCNIEQILVFENIFFDVARVQSSGPQVQKFQEHAYLQKGCLQPLLPQLHEKTVCPC